MARRISAQSDGSNEASSACTSAGDEIRSRYKATPSAHPQLTDNLSLAQKPFGCTRER